MTRTRYYRQQFPTWTSGLVAGAGLSFLFGGGIIQTVTSLGCLAMSWLTWRAAEVVRIEDDE